MHFVKLRNVKQRRSRRRMRRRRVRLKVRSHVSRKYTKQQKKSIVRIRRSRS